jgi:hypothetical protein
VLGHLQPAISGQRAPQRCGQLANVPAQGGDHCNRIFAGHLHQHGESRWYRVQSNRLVPVRSNGPHSSNVFFDGKSNATIPAGAELSRRPPPNSRSKTFPGGRNGKTQTHRQPGRYPEREGPERAGRTAKIPFEATRRHSCEIPTSRDSIGASALKWRVRKNLCSCQSSRIC